MTQSQSNINKQYKQRIEDIREANDYTNLEGNKKTVTESHPTLGINSSLLQKLKVREYSRAPTLYIEAQRLPIGT